MRENVMAMEVSSRDIGSCTTRVLTKPESVLAVLGAVQLHDSTTFVMGSLAGCLRSSMFEKLDV